MPSGGTVIVNLPLASVTVLTWEPFNRTITPGSGSPWSDVTVPWTLISAHRTAAGSRAAMLLSGSIKESREHTIAPLIFNVVFLYITRV
jgi:hypothetical protein